MEKIPEKIAQRYSQIALKIDDFLTITKIFQSQVSPIEYIIDGYKYDDLEIRDAITRLPPKIKRFEISSNYNNDLISLTFEEDSIIFYSSNKSVPKFSSIFESIDTFLKSKVLSYKRG